MKIKALTLWQPWASFMALGLKKNETRSWSTSYRGPLAIHAAKKAPRWIPNELVLFSLERLGPGNRWPYGKILCVVDLIGIEKSDGIIKDPSSTEIMLGDYSKGRFIWQTKMLQVFDNPIPARGYQGLWDWEWEK